MIIIQLILLTKWMIYVRVLFNLEFPDYAKRIKKPMCLDDVKLNLNNKEYKKDIQFFKDIQLIWSNCKDYNISNSTIYKTCEILEKQANDLEKLYYNNKFEDYKKLRWFIENQKNTEQDEKQKTSKRLNIGKPSKTKEVKRN